MPAVLGVWNLRGLGQSIRLLLEYAEVDYSERPYKYGPAPDYSRSEWLAEKCDMGLDFPNLPYYCDGNIKLTHCSSILKHIGRKHNLVGQSEAENIRIDMVEHEALDWRNAHTNTLYTSAYEKLRDGYISGTMKTKLENFSKFLGNNKWFGGDNLTYVDFLIYELLDIHRHLSPSSFNGFDNLNHFLSKFESLEPIKKYMNSNRFIKYPLNAPWAGFGGK